MKKQTLIVRQLQGIRKVAIKNMDKNPEYFSMLISTIDETLNEIHLDQIAQVEAIELACDYAYS